MPNKSGLMVIGSVMSPSAPLGTAAHRCTCSYTNYILSNHVKTNPIEIYEQIVYQDDTLLMLDPEQV